MALQGKVDECVTFWAICCSSWVHMNAGTSRRDFLTPMGCQAFNSVLVANLLVSRWGPIPPGKSHRCSKNSILKSSALPSVMRYCTLSDLSPTVARRSVLLILLCVAMGGTPVVENPGSSLLWLHERFQWLLETLERFNIRVPLLIFITLCVCGILFGFLDANLLAQCFVDL